MFPEIITELLQDGYKVSFSAPGHSMYPTIMANETILVEPVDPGKVRLGDILLYRANGRLVAHRVIGISRMPESGFFSEEKPDNQPSSNQIFESGGPFIEHSTAQGKCSSNEVLLFVLRGDACPATDSPVTADQILGKVISVERDGCSVDPYSFAHKLGCLARRWTSRFKAILN